MALSVKLIPRIPPEASGEWVHAFFSQPNLQLLTTPWKWLCKCANRQQNPQTKGPG